MTFYTYVKDSLWNLVSNKLRSFLSILWIVIWLFAVIFLMSVWTWAQQSIKDKMATLITNNITITAQWWYSQWTNDEVHWYVKAINLNTWLVAELEYAFPMLSGKVTYSNMWMWQLENSDWDKAMGMFAWVPINYMEQMWYKWNYGSQFTQSNYDKSEKVVIVNKNVVDSLFDSKYCIWEQIYYNGEKFRVIWVLDEESILWMAYIPITTYQYRIAWWSTKISNVTVILWVDDDVDDWMTKLKYFLLRKYNIKHIDLAGFSLASAASIWTAIDDAMNIFTYLLAAIGSVSLLVWWIWIMNIMLVSVTERTREIWIRKAIWALNKDIITQFLIESIVITAIWWIFAILLSWWAIEIVNSFKIENLNIAMTGEVVVVATLLTFIIWIISWILPAKKAADLQPIDALRFE